MIVVDAKPDKCWQLPIHITTVSKVGYLLSTNAQVQKIAKCLKLAHFAGPKPLKCFVVLIYNAIIGTENQYSTQHEVTTDYWWPVTYSYKEVNLNVAKPPMAV